MIPNTNDTVEVVSSITGQVGQFSVDENSLTKIMSVLTNLYSDPEGAVVREYLTNALDSQIEAQQADANYVWRPIEVTTPSHFSKAYVVRDFGIGMSVDDIVEIYSKYGKSTKEHSNEVTGMLGLGSKCALTYTSQFTITGFKNGVRTKAIVSKNEQDIPEFMIVDTRATDEPNGVEISVPVRDRSSFAHKTEEFLKWWDEGQVLVDGREPRKHGYTEVKPGVFMIESRYDDSVIIMGNVPYIVDSEYVPDTLTQADMAFAAYVPMGAVDFPPSRERLFYNKRTKDTIRSVAEGLVEHVINAKKKEIQDATTPIAAWTAHNNLSYALRRHPQMQLLTYNGFKFVDAVTCPNMTLKWDYDGRGHVRESSHLSVRDLAEGGIIITGVSLGSKPTTSFKRKVEQYLDDKGLKRKAVLVNVDTDSVWASHLPRVSAETIRAIKLPRASTGPRPEAKYDFYWYDAAGDEQYEAEYNAPVAAGDTVVYASPADLKSQTNRWNSVDVHPLDVLKRLGPGHVVAIMGKNRYEKFKRSHPKAISLQTALQNKINELSKQASDIHAILSELSYTEQRAIGKLVADNINDPALAEIIRNRNVKTGADKYAQARDLYTWSHKVACTVNLPARKGVVNPLKNYPLLSSDATAAHLTIYVNAIYDASQA